jgi:dienelactone hydrolase
MVRLFKSIALIAGFALTGCASLGANITDSSKQRFKDNKFQEARVINDASFIYGNPVFLPKGKQNGGAVIFMAPCPGFAQFNDRDAMAWVHLLTDNGYTVMPMSINGFERPNRNCGPNKPLPQERMAKDVFDAANHLAKIPGVDPTKIFAMGQSLGAMIATYALREKYVNQAKEAGWVIPAGAVALYGGCSYKNEDAWLSNNLVRPVLWMSGTKDVERGTGCHSWLYNSVKKNAPGSEFIDYQGATHCWDCSQLNGWTKKTFFGNQVYTYDPVVTKKSQEDTLRFLNKLMN